MNLSKDRGTRVHYKKWIKITIWSHILCYVELTTTCNTIFASSGDIRETRLYSFDPLKPHFNTVKLGFTGVYIIFVISAQKHRLWILVRTASTRRI